MSVDKILNQIANTPGKLDKIALLEANKANEDLKQTVLYALDPRRNFNIRKIPAYLSPANPTKTLKDVFPLLDKFAEREITGNAAINELQRMLSNLSAEDAKVLERILDKSLDSGMEKSVNKVYGADFIQETPYMRCDLTNTKTLAKLRWLCPDGTPGVYGEIKSDGQYLNHLVVHGFYNAESRNGKSYDFMGSPDKDFQDLAAKLKELYGAKYPLENIVFNGEGVVVDDKGQVLPRTTGNGIIQKFGKESGSVLELDNIRFVLWDFLPHENYKKNEWNVPRKERRTMLDTAIKALEAERAIVIRMVEFRPLKNFAEAFAWNTEVMGRGEEGIIIKDERGTWKSHTSPFQLKLKLKFDVDLVVVGIEEGTGKLEDSMGAVICETSDGKLRVGVGSGWKEKVDPKDPDSLYYTRDWVWENRLDLIGAILMIEANDIVQDKKNPEMWSLFLPSVKNGEWRTDKNTADTVERVFEAKAMVIAAGGKMGANAL